MAGRDENNEIIFAIPKGKPPVAAKRGSLPDITRLKLARVPSHLALSRQDSRKGSLSSLCNGRERSGSFTGAATLPVRTLSASNLAALSDSNLSIKEALPYRSYDEPNSQENIAKVYFEQLVRQYYTQLTEGCGNADCKNKFCFSCTDGLKCAPHAATVFSIELASGNKPYLCLAPGTPHKPLPPQVLKVPEGERKPFFLALLSSSPFRFLFAKPDSARSSIPQDSHGDHEAKTSSRKAKHNLTNHSSTVDKDDRYSHEKPRFSVGDPSSEELGHDPSALLKQRAIQNMMRRNSLGPLSDALQAAGQLLSRGISSSLSSLTGKQQQATNKISSIKASSVTKLQTGSASKIYSSRPLAGDIVNGHLDNVSSHGSSALPLCGSGEAYADLEEFERQVAMELHGQEFSLTHLTLPMLQSVIDKYKETGDQSFLINTIRTVFTTSDALNQSFKRKEDKEASLQNLDLAAVREAFALIMTIADRDIGYSALVDAIEIMLSTLAKSQILIAYLPQLVILLECPLLKRKDNHSLRQKMCVVLAGMCAQCKTALARLLMHYEPERFSHLMGLFNNHLVLSVKQGQRADGQIIYIAKTIELFYVANYKGFQARGQPIVPWKLFYINAFSWKLDFKYEYEQWCLQHDTPYKHQTVLDFPFLLDPPSKVQVLHLDAVVQMRKEYQEAILHQARVNQVQKYRRGSSQPLSLPNSIKAAMSPFLVLEVHRDHLITDTLAQIRLKESDLKKPLKIKYVGGGEQGLDMGGLQKEFFQLICGSVFDPDYGMFSHLEESRSLWINGACTDSNDEFELVGIILGLAIYNGVILDVKFPTAIYKKLQGVRLGLQDLQDLQPILVRSLQNLLEYEGDLENDFCQTFQITVPCLGGTTTVDLVPNGGSLAVNKNNRDHFVTRYVDYILNRSIESQFEAFSKGFHKVCRRETLALFQPEEIELLVCGSPELDFKALEKSTTYEDGYHVNHRSVRAFWALVHGMQQDHKKKLLHFITGSDKVPLKGLGHLPIVIMRNGGDSNRLPTAMTCFNRLLLPSYATAAKLKDRLITAIENGKGFGLT